MIRADLHIHSCLSPCADLEMGPCDVVKTAIQQGLTHIALTDHNTTRNSEAFYLCAQKEGLTCIPGIEVTTAEEAHILCYFPSVENANLFGEIIENSLIKIPLNPEKMGDQPFLNSDEEILGEIDFYLSVTSSFSVDEVVLKAQEFNAIVIPAHIDKPIFSLISQLGFLPELPYNALEISSGGLRNNYQSNDTTGFQTITGSDSHYLHTIGTAGFTVETDSKDLWDILSQLQKDTPDLRIQTFTQQR